MFNLLVGKPKTPTVPTESNLKAKRNYSMTHSQAKVANVLRKPGQFSYTNKERIESEYQKAIAELKKIEKPKETASALQTLATKLRDAAESDAARKAGAVTITIPVGVAQLAWKAMWFFVAAMAFLFIDIPSMGTIPVSAALAPNRNFNTTRSTYDWAKEKTGAQNWS